MRNIRRIATEILNKSQKKTIDRLKKVPGFQEAYKRLVSTKDLKTGDAKYFNISIESFLRWAQRSKEKQEEMINKLIDMFK